MLGRDRALPLAPRELFAATRAVRHPCWSRSGGSCCSRTTQRFGAFGEVEGAIVREETPASRSLLGGDRELLEYDLV
jgi:hypothetical protein